VTPVSVSCRHSHDLGVQHDQILTAFHITVDSVFAGPSETGANSSVRGSATGGTSEYSAGSEDTLSLLAVFVSIWIGSLSVPGLSFVSSCMIEMAVP